MTQEKPTPVYRCSKCGLPCEVIEVIDMSPNPVRFAGINVRHLGWKSACCNAPADPVKEAGR